MKLCKYFDENGLDVSLNFIKGAKESLKLIEQQKIKKAILKSRSPSCGCGQVYNKDQLVSGNGVTAELLLSYVIIIITV